MTTSNPKVGVGGESQAGQDELEQAMKTLRKARQVPPVTPVTKPTSKKAKPQTKKGKVKKGKTKSVEEVNPSAPEPEDDIDEVEKFDSKGQLSSQELKFVTFRFVEGMTIDNAMKSAGYENYSQRQRFRIAAKIVQKYESSGGDHRKIFRDIGAGETAVAQGLLKLATTAESEMVRLNAWATIARCLGLKKDVVDIQHGISIIIQGRAPAQAQSTEPPTGGGRPALAHTDKGALPGPTPLVITS